MKLFLMDEEDYVLAEQEDDARQHRLEVTGEHTDVIEELPMTIMCNYQGPPPAMPMLVTAATLVRAMHPEEFPTFIECQR